MLNYNPGRDQVSGSIVERLLDLQQGVKDWNSYINTLVTVQQCILPVTSQSRILHCLFSLFFSPDSHQGCKAHGSNKIYRYNIFCVLRKIK